MPEIDQKLLQAYSQALYRVEGELDFKIGEYSAKLERLHSRHHARHSHFITAFNPESKRLPADENALRHSQLGEKLAALGVRRLPAAGLDPDGHWPPEPGYLVFDMLPKDVLTLGRAYEQNAVVAIGPDAIPALIVIAPPRVESSNE